MGTTVYNSAPPWSPVQGQVYLYYPSMKCAHIYKWLSQVLDIDTCMGKKTYKSKLPNLWPVDPGFFFALHLFTHFYLLVGYVCY